MNLPTVSVPTFRTAIPSTGQKIQYRPFLVKEEKVLLMALEGGDVNEMTEATKNVIESCLITDKVDINKLTTFDVEYLLLQLRSKSVGEVVELSLGHTGDNECKAKTEVSVKLDDIKVKGVKKDRNIMVTDTIGVTIHYPSINDALILQSDDKDATFKLIARCIDVVFDQDNVYEDFTAEEMEQWLESLNQQQFDNISSFFDPLPSISHEVKWKCKECGQTDSFTIEGLQSFFM